MTSVASPALPVAGTALYHELRTFLRAAHYAPVNIDEALAFIEANGTTTGCGSLEPDDQAEANIIILNRVSHLEYASAADWPALFDEEAWGVSDRTPTDADRAFPAPSAPAFRPSDPSPADRLWWTVTSDAEARTDAALDRLEFEGRALELMTRGLAPHDPTPAGSDWGPAENAVRSRVAEAHTDADQLRAHGAV